jgi:hypothetical protein
MAKSPDSTKPRSSRRVRAAVPLEPSDAGAPLARTTARRAPTHDEIARRAYELFLQRGGQHGSHEQDWLRAESELLAN